MFSKKDAEQFIERLKCFYGAEFNRKWANVAPVMLVETICATFQNITPQQLQTCLKRISVSSSEFCPSLPALLALCYSEIKSEQEAYRLMSDIKNIKDPLVYEVHKRIGSWAWGHMQESKARPLFIEIYREVKAEVMSGKVFVIPAPVAYVPPEPIVRDPRAQEAARKYLEELKKKL